VELLNVEIAKLRKQCYKHGNLPEKKESRRSRDSLEVEDDADKTLTMTIYCDGYDDAEPDRFVAGSYGLRWEALATLMAQSESTL
jgi:hypothetical protein